MRESDDGEKDEMYVATSESGLTCVCDKSWAGGRRGQGSRAASYKVRPPLFTATFLQFYNKSSPSVRADNCAPVCGAGQLLGPRIRQHLGPLTALTTCCSTYSRYFTFVCYCKSYFCSNTRMCNKAAHHFPSSAAQFLSLLPIQGHTRGGGRYFVSTSPKT